MWRVPALMDAANAVLGDDATKLWTSRALRGSFGSPGAESS